MNVVETSVHRHPSSAFLGMRRSAIVAGAVSPLAGTYSNTQVNSTIVLLYRMPNSSSLVLLSLRDLGDVGNYRGEGCHARSVRTDESEIL